MEYCNQIERRKGKERRTIVIDENKTEKEKREATRREEDLDKNLHYKTIFVAYRKAIYSIL